MATATATAPAFGWISYFLRGMGDCVFGLSGQGLAIACQLPSMVKRLGTCLFRRGGVMSRHCLWLPDMCKAPGDSSELGGHVTSGSHTCI
jgi:hypothetical protein